jgi:hypothetical protein
MKNRAPEKDQQKLVKLAYALVEPQLYKYAGDTQVDKFKQFLEGYRNCGEDTVGAIANVLTGSATSLDKHYFRGMKALNRVYGEFAPTGAPEFTYHERNPSQINAAEEWIRANHPEIADRLDALPHSLGALPPARKIVFSDAQLKQLEIELGALLSPKQQDLTPRLLERLKRSAPSAHNAATPENTSGTTDPDVLAEMMLTRHERGSMDR